MNLNKITKWNDNYALILCFVLSGMVMLVAFSMVIQK